MYRFCFVPVYSENDIEVATKKCVNTVEESINTVKNKRKYHKKAPRMTNVTLKLVNRKNELFIIFKKMYKHYSNNLSCPQSTKNKEVNIYI